MCKKVPIKDKASKKGSKMPSAQASYLLKLLLNLKPRSVAIFPLAIIFSKIRKRRYLHS